MMTLIHEHPAWLRILRMLGMDRSERARIGAWEGLGLSLVGALGGLVLGAGLGLILIYFVNVQSFGWTLQLAIPWAAWSVLVCTLVALGSFTGWLVGRWSTTLPTETL